MKKRDGSVVSSYFTGKPAATGKDVYDKGSTTMVGQIEKIHFIDDATNVSKQFVEYDVSVRDAYGGQSVFRNVRPGSGIGGTNNSEETILEANEIAVRGKLDTSNQFGNKNGTIVAISFLDNSLDKPYISDVLDHPSNEGAKRADGIRKLSEFQGIRQEINKDGEYILTYLGGKDADGSNPNKATAPTIFKIDKDGNLTLSTNEGQSFKLNRKDKKITVTDSNNTLELDKTGKKITIDAGGKTVVIDGAANKIILTAGSTVINIDGASGKIELTGSLVDIGEAASALAVLGPQLQAWLNTHTHTVPVIGGSSSGNHESLIPTVPAPISILSTTVKVKS